MGLPRGRGRAGTRPGEKKLVSIGSGTTTSLPHAFVYSLSFHSADRVSIERR